MTSLTPEELADAVAKIVALESRIRPDGVMDAQTLGHNIFMFRQESENMAQVIRQLWAEREANRADIERLGEALHKADLEMHGYAITLQHQRAVMQQARDGLESIRDACINSVGAGAPAGQVRQYAFDASFKALTALDAALGRV